MSIDTLKIGDGYRRANWSIIRKMLLAGHTEHLQTEHGLVAIRPYVGERESWKVVDMKRVDVTVPDKCVTVERRTKHGDDSHSFSLRNGMTDAIRFIFVALNGAMDTGHEAGDSSDVWANQAEREGCILATIGDEAILEYEMPGTTTQWQSRGRTMGRVTSALRIITTIGDETITFRACSYNAVPQKWLAAIRASGMDDWLGMGQRSLERIPFPAE